MKSKKLAIVGMGRGSDLAPWNDPAFECWTLNAAWRDQLNADTLSYPASVTAWFELHSRAYLLEEWKGKMTHFTALGLLDVPVFVQDAEVWPELKHAKTFPRAAIQKAFPRGDYHASSLDWMLTYALWTKRRHIEIWGVNFGPTDAGEPLSARACLEYWIGFAEGRGAKVLVHDPTGLFWIYNYARERTPYHYDDSWRLVENR